MPPDSIPEGIIFQNFLGACPRLPSAGMLHMPVCLHTMSVNMPANLYIMEA